MGPRRVASDYPIDPGDDLSAEDYDLRRLEKIAGEGLALVREEAGESGTVAPDTLALQTFAIVAVFAYETPQGEERESTTVWSETKRRHVQVGILQCGQERLDEQLDPDD